MKNSKEKNTSKTKTDAYDFYKKKEQAKEVEIEKLILKLKESKEKLKQEYIKDSIFNNITFLDWLKIMLSFQKVAERVGTTRSQLYKEYKNYCSFRLRPLSFDIWLEEILLFDFYAKKMETSRERLKKEYENSFFSAVTLNEWLEKEVLFDTYAKKLGTTRKSLHKEWISDTYFLDISLKKWLEIMIKLDELAKKQNTTRKKLLKDFIKASYTFNVPTFMESLKQAEKKYSGKKK